MAKLGFADTTPMPPISGMRTTIVPPAAATNWSTLAGSEPFANATVYIAEGAVETPRVAAEPAVVTSNAVAKTVMAAAALPTRFL